MSDERALLAAIWEHPHEDTPRLVYADWLDEHDNSARAEFIRVQCELARIDEWDEAPRFKELKARERELWVAHGTAWKNPLGFGFRNTPFRRGFAYPHPKAFGGAAFLKAKPTDFDAAPQWSFTVQSFVRQFPRVFDSPLLLKADHLLVDAAKVTGDVYSALAERALTRNLTALDIHNADDNPESAAALFNSAATASVERLWPFTLSSASLAALATSPVAERLREFRAGLTDLDEGELPRFGPKRFPRLRKLDLSHTMIGGRAREDDDPARALRILEALFTRESESAIRELNLSWCRMRSDSLAHLLMWPGARHLRRLDLSRNTLDPPAFDMLVRAENLVHLKSLVVDRYWVDQVAGASEALDARFGSVISYN